MNITEIRNKVLKNNYDLACLTPEELELYNRYYELLDNIGRRVKHFKGKTYIIENISCYTPTNTLLVNYIPEEKSLVPESDSLYDRYSRPLEEFLSEVDHGKYPLEKQKYRFEFIGG